MKIKDECFKMKTKVFYEQLVTSVYEWRKLLDKIHSQINDPLSILLLYKGILTSDNKKNLIPKNYFIINFNLVAIILKQILLNVKYVNQKCWFMHNIK